MFNLILLQRVPLIFPKKIIFSKSKLGNFQRYFASEAIIDSQDGPFTQEYTDFSSPKKNTFKLNGEVFYKTSLQRTSCLVN